MIIFVTIIDFVFLMFVYHQFGFEQAVITGLVCICAELGCARIERNK